MGRGESFFEGFVELPGFGADGLQLFLMGLEGGLGFQGRLEGGPARILGGGQVSLRALQFLLGLAALGGEGAGCAELLQQILFEHLHSNLGPFFLNHQVGEALVSLGELGLRLVPRVFRLLHLSLDGKEVSRGGATQVQFVPVASLVANQGLEAHIRVFAEDIQ